MSVFGAKSDKSAIYKTSAAVCTINGVSDAVLLQVGIQVSRQLSPIMTIGSGVQWAAQPPSGTLTASTILTTSADLVSAFGADKDSCEKITISLDMKDSICSGGSSGGKRFDIKDAYCSQVSFSMSGQQGYIGQDFTAQFTEVEVSAI